MAEMETELTWADLMAWFYKRYVDDMNAIIGKNEVENALNSLIRPRANSEFTLEMEKKPQLPFLGGGGDREQWSWRSTGNFQTQNQYFPALRTTLIRKKVTFVKHVMYHILAVSISMKTGWKRPNKFWISLDWTKEDSLTTRAKVRWREIWGNMVWTLSSVAETASSKLFWDQPRTQSTKWSHIQYI